jgi:hypothetical protein
MMTTLLLVVVVAACTVGRLVYQARILKGRR